MAVRRLWLVDFRNYTEAEVSLADGLTVVEGRNGQGKTNLLEAVGYLATLRSFRGATTETLVRAGAQRAIVRGEAQRDGRDLLIEAELVAGGRGRALLNHQKVSRRRDLLEAISTTVFAPDDLELVKGGPAERRAYVDDLVAALHPRGDSAITEVERVVKQRNALLKQVGGRLPADAELTLDVWDQKLAAAGEDLARRRADVVDRLSGPLDESYRLVAGQGSGLAIRYDAPWRQVGLAAALAEARTADVRRGVTTVGPHRDDHVLTLSGLPARTHASQGEQRSTALALRLGGHRLVTEATGHAPVLLLDDVFSELDAGRSTALVAALPPGQTLLSTAGALPPGVQPDLRLEVVAGTVR